MTLADWFSTRIDGSLHWQQSLVMAVVVAIVLGPVQLWWRYDFAPRTTAAHAVRMAFGPDSTFRATRLLNHVDQHSGLFPGTTGADVLVCGVVRIGDEEAPVAVLAKRMRRGGLTREALFSPGYTEHHQYPDAGPMVLDLCAREAQSA